MTRTLGAVFFASGASALIFENLWFRETGVLLGNGVWATSLVLAAFMAGLAFGGWLVGRFGHRAGRLVRLYGLLELAVAGTGLGVVLVLPSLTELCAPLFGTLDGAPLNAARLAIAFAVLIVPATAMGATLPVLVAALSRQEASFGRVLGRLYGWNTLGAVAGILAVELVLVPRLGIRGTACVALVLSGTAGTIALLVSRSLLEPVAEPVAIGGTTSWTTRRVLASSFLCGAALLALEVIWFRFLALFVLGTTFALSLMLAVILAGIGLGGLAASAWIHRRERQAEELVRVLAVLGGVATFAAYLAFRVDALPGSHRWQDAIGDALRLALPTAILSGGLFTILGNLAKKQLSRETRAAGSLVVWNTLGAMVGALAGGFVLLPALGVDGSFFVICVLYGGVAACIPSGAERPRAAKLREYVAFAVLAACLALFPFGKMRRHVEELLSNVTSDDAAIIAYREGLTATLSVIEHRWEDQPVSDQLVTDGFSMSSTAYSSRRYMKLFVYLPVALRPDPKQALLVCYGVGQTAKALVDTASLEHIDVVDISREILDLGRVEFPRDFPLDDPRVAVHVEDGRFFLQTTPQRYDLITGEPPPPQVAGVVNLYTREYFELVREHLTEGGITSYWLPVHQLSVEDTQAIARAFCEVFADCSLWTGFGYEWELIGTRGFTGGTSEARFTQQWRDPRVAPELRAIGVERPEQLGALFMADAPTLVSWIGSVAPLDDDHPARLGTGSHGADRDATFVGWMDVGAARQRFASSLAIRSLWPPALREATLPFFAIQRFVDALPDTTPIDRATPAQLAERLRALDEIQRTTDLRTLVLLMLGYTAAHEQIVDELHARRDPELELARGVRALADRKFEEAALHFAAVAPQSASTSALRAYALAPHGQ